MSRHQWNRVTVVGCGLIGASFALALRRCGAAAHIAGWDTSRAALDVALANNIIDEVDEAFGSHGVSASDLVYLAMPVSAIIDFLIRRWASVKPGAIVTDAGSTKVEVCRAAFAHLPPDRFFIGGHPIAGSQRSTCAHARADLFVGAGYVLIAPERQNEGDAPAALTRTLDMLGARVMLMTAAEHDRALALVSHLPQLISSALAATVNRQADASALLDIAGTGYHDMTRLADSSWTVWQDVFATNAVQVADSLALLIEKLEAARDELRLLQNGENDHTLQAVSALFREAKGSGE